MNGAVILSGGAGSRFGAGAPKQYRELAGRPVIVRTMEALQRCPAVEHIVVVAETEWREPVLGWAERFGVTKLRKLAPAGKDRQHSILNGLLALEGLLTGPEDGVVIQDAARPLTSQELLARLLLGLHDAPAVLPVVPVTDTVYTSGDGQWVNGIPDRAALYAGQAPEAFRFGDYLSLYRNTPAERLSALSGSCQLPCQAGWKVKMIEGEAENRKLTYPMDWTICQLILKEREEC